MSRPSIMNQIGIRVAPLSRRIVLARFGKDPCVALETTDAQSDFWQALILFAFDGETPEPGKAAEIKFGGGNDQFTCTVKRTS